MSRIPIRLPGPKSKYRAVRTEGYASKKEAKRGAELKLLEKIGEISELEEQVRFDILDRQFEDGKLVEAALYYVADFVYRNKQGTKIIEDCKGMRTQVYVIKRKLLRYFRGIRITEI